ncbi:MAG: hypothetical protein AAF615_07635 [Pseudomonadota bacterium]
MTAQQNNERSEHPFTGGSRDGTSVPSAGSSGTRETLPVPAASADEPKPKKRPLWFRPTPVNVKLIYAGYLISLAIPFVALAAAFSAHQASKHEPPHWLATHYTYQLRTFWMGLIANLVAWGLSFAGVGLLMFPLIAVWVVARAVKGLIRVAQGVEIEEPESYFV